MDCSACGEGVPPAARFCPSCGAEAEIQGEALVEVGNSLDETQDPASSDSQLQTGSSKRLRRARDGRVVAGVMAGLSARTGINVYILRLVWLTAALLTAGAIPILIYSVAAVIMPDEKGRSLLKSREPIDADRDLGSVGKILLNGLMIWDGLVKGLLVLVLLLVIAIVLLIASM